PSVQPAGSWPVATSTPTATARSRPAPPFRMPEGARLTVTRRSGHGSPLDSRAARTRSRDSRTAASGSPTMVKPGRPFDTWTSTAIGRPTVPIRVAAEMEASMHKKGRHRPWARQRGFSVPVCFRLGVGPPADGCAEGRQGEQRPEDGELGRHLVVFLLDLDLFRQVGEHLRQLRSGAGGVALATG